MLEKLKKMLAKKEERKKELRTKVKESEDVVELREINEELLQLDEDVREIKGLMAQAEARENNQEGEEGEERSTENPEGEERASGPVGDTQVVATYGIGNGEETGDAEKRAKMKEKYEQRGKDLKDGKKVTFSLDELPEFRAVTVGGGTLVVPSHESNTLNEKFNEVSSLIDRVHSVPLPGGNAYKKGFEVSAGEGDYTTEEGEYADADPEYDYVDINKAKITAYAEISDEAVNLPNINYQSMVAKDIQTALRKKMTKHILVGEGGSNALNGIFNAPTKVIPSDSDKEVAEIDEDTLDQIVFGYGGDEEIEGGAVLVLNKKDLAAFAAVRLSDGKKAYKIKKDRNNGNTGTISSEGSFQIDYVINSAAPALSAEGTAGDTYCMAYGMVQAYEMPIFSDVEVEESKDFRFKSGQIAYRGSVWAGGNVAKYKGFMRIKKAAAV
ncbi:MAG: phage major capsid protein [Halanaerobiales bacterium]